MTHAPTAAPLAADIASPCQECGACCAYSADWPRFSTEDDAALDRIPAAHVRADLSGMRCDGDRCSALLGRIGASTACSIYPLRPDVCHACLPGDAECNIARLHHGLPVLPTRAAERDRWDA